MLERGLMAGRAVKVLWIGPIRESEVHLLKAGRADRDGRWGAHIVSHDIAFCVLLVLDGGK